MNSAQRHEVAAMEMRERKRVTDLLARAEREELDAAWEALTEKPVAQPVRGPETGLVMVRGRIGGGGSPFNLGEVTVTRTTVRLASGKVGHGHALGTDKQRSRLAAIFDALWQEPGTKDFVERTILAPVAERIAAADAKKAVETAATRVDFFTMVRGEDK
ncbi:phosphonate C-P lyase system protein PhnG [Rhizobium tubonense]|uniref:Phosphonate C-P lyase system protein PhnG n=1 Tax=Rhizobium tubonense TaxID=484088 RepID=A0A2W4ERV9_9HYPH|nr:phosphonate C-P lyase system protein PhnG [Rhizobium tubonense]PZM16106.1 phosphonate C-P lyase system protein PhnG [Rhizobium tubonense]